MAKSKSPSENDLIRIPDWEAADDLLRRLGDAVNTIAALEADADVRINQIKSGLSVQVDNLKKNISRLVNSLEQFALAHKEEFGESRSRQLNFGTLGWRKSTRIAVAKTTLDRIREVFGKKAADYLHIKESIDKDALSKLTDEELKSVSARRKVTDGFFAEADLVKAAEH